MHLGIFAKTFVRAPSQPPGQASDQPPDQASEQASDQASDDTAAAAVFAAARAAGYDCVQYNMACSGLGPLPATVTPVQAQAVGTAARDSGVQVAALSATYNMIHPDPATRAAGRASLAAMAAQAHAMGTGLLTLCTGSADARDQWRHHPDNRSAAAWATMMTEFEALIEIADRHDLLLGVEPELANVIDSAEAALRLIRQADSPRIRIVLDPANLVEVATPDTRRRVIAKTVDLLADRIVMAHAKDRHADGSFATAGRGVIDFADFLTRLRDAGFDGPLVTHGLPAAEAAAVARFLRRLA